MNKKLRALLKAQGPILERAFIAAIEDLRDGINFAALITALEMGDIEAALAALDIDFGAFAPFLQASNTAYAAAGATIISSIPPGPSNVVFRFNLANPRAESHLARHAAQLVTILVEEEKAALRATLLAGYSQGKGSQQLANEIAGKVNPLTKKREGSIIGLSGPQQGYLQTFRDRLASGDPREMRKVLKGNTLRDKRFDKAIRKAIAAGQPLPDDMIAKMAAGYENKLLKRRASDIARDELGTAVEAARKEAFLQTVEKEGISEQAIRREWNHGGGEGPNARPDHAAMHGQIRYGTTDPFVMDDMSPKIHAMDGVGGAKQDANCRCSTRWEVDWTHGM